jgi:hypothetical protein
MYPPPLFSKAFHLPRRRAGVNEHVAAQEKLAVMKYFKAMVQSDDLDNSKYGLQSVYCPLSNICGRRNTQNGLEMGDQAAKTQCCTGLLPFMCLPGPDSTAVFKSQEHACSGLELSVSAAALRSPFQVSESGEATI